MKKQFPTLTRCLIGLALLLATLFSTPASYGLAQGTRVVLDPSGNKVAGGATTQVGIRIEGVTDLFGTAMNGVDQAAGEIHFAITSGESPTPTATSVSSPIPTPTPDPSPTPTLTPSVTPTPTGDILGYHIVQSGETLFCIGRAYGVDPYAIATQNGILNPNIVHAGQRLAIPDVPRTLPPGRVCPRQFNGGAPPPTCRWYHTVAWGENLYRISLRYGVNMWTIAEANHILNLHYIRAGQVLCIP